MKYSIAFLFFLHAVHYLLAADSLTISSPDKKIDVTVHYKDRLNYSIRYLGQAILLPSIVDLQLQNGKSLSDNLHIDRRSIRSFHAAFGSADGNARP